MKFLRKSIDKYIFKVYYITKIKRRREAMNMKMKKILFLACSIAVVSGIFIGIYLHHQMTAGAMRHLQKEIKQNQIVEER